MGFSNISMLSVIVLTICLLHIISVSGKHRKHSRTHRDRAVQESSSEENYSPSGRYHYNYRYHYRGHPDKGRKSDKRKRPKFKGRRRHKKLEKKQKEDEDYFESVSTEISDSSERKSSRGRQSEPKKNHWHTSKSTTIMPPVANGNQTSNDGPQDKNSTSTTEGRTPEIVAVTQRSTESPQQPKIYQMVNEGGGVRKCTFVGKYAIKDNCVSYNKCTRMGNFARQTYCPAGSQFDHLRRSCVRTGTASCDSSLICPDDSTHHPAEPFDRRFHLRCVDGVPMPAQCSHEHYYSEKDGCVEH